MKVYTEYVNVFVLIKVLGRDSFADFSTSTLPFVFVLKIGRTAGIRKGGGDWVKIEWAAVKWVGIW